MDAQDLVLHAEFLRRLAGGLLADGHLAEDAAQEAIAASLGSRDVRNLRAWLAGVTRNVSLRMLRAASVRRRAERAAARREALPSAEALASDAETQHRVAAAVLQLDEPYRSAVLLRFYRRLTPSEIARRSGEPVATVKTRLRRALATLRARLDEAHGGDRRSWSVALFPLVAHRPVAGGVLGGVAIMKTKILVATAVLALLATLFAVVKSGDGPEPVRLAGPAASGARVAAVEEAPGDPAARLDHAAPGGEPRPEPVADGEVESYRELRRVAPVFAACQRNTREAHALIEELGGAEEPPPPVADPVTAAYLRDLIRDYRAQQAGAERLDLLRRILETHGRYLEATHDTSFLSFLEDVCSVSDVGVERELAVPGCDDRTLDLLLRLSVHRDPAVRAAAVRALADDPRGFDAVARALGDDASTVRWTAAIELQYAATDPARIPALLDRIRAETHPLAADSMVRAICALDPENGAGRIESAVASAPDSVRDVVLKALRSPEPEGALAAPRMPPQAPEARPDAETRAYLERLVQTYRSLPQGQERLAAAERLAEAHAAYFRITEDGSFLPILGEIARGSPDVDERVAVVGSFHSAQDRRVVDLVVELKGSAEPLVRSSVAGVFAWVQGPEAPRARKELLEMLRDRAASVRIAVASLVAVLGGEGDAALLLARLGGETDVAAAYAMIEAILRLDPERGRERIAAVEANSSVIEAALRLRGERAK